MGNDQPVQVKEYKSLKEYQKDAAKLIGQGWEVKTMTIEKRRGGCLFGGLLFGGKTLFIVTYTRQSKTPSIS